MKYPIALLIPVLMLADYVGTVLGATRAERAYNNYFATDHYELNPVWQEAIANRKWFNPRHLAGTVLFSGALIFLTELNELPIWLVEGVLGAVLTMFAVLAGRHLSNVLIFEYVIRNPERLSGRVVMDHSLTLAVSAFQYLLALIPIAFIAVVTRDAFVVGGVAGIGWLLAYHIGWGRKARAQTVVSKDEIPRNE